MSLELPINTSPPQAPEICITTSGLSQVKFFLWALLGIFVALAISYFCLGLVGFQEYVYVGVRRKVCRGLEREDLGTEELGLIDDGQDSIFQVRIREELR
jgi:hypothetical protein